MAKIQDFNLTKERKDVREMLEEIQTLLNNGNYEIDVTNASEPAFDPPQETKFVLSIFGGQFRLYISFQGDWYFATLGILP